MIESAPGACETLGNRSKSLSWHIFGPADILTGVPELVPGAPVVTVAVQADLPSSQVGAELLQEP